MEDSITKFKSKTKIDKQNRLEQIDSKEICTNQT